MDTIDKIFMLLDSKGVEQKEFAAHIGVSASAVSDWRKRRITSYKKHIDKIADYFDVSTDYLLGIEKKTPPQEQSLNENDLELKKIIKVLNIEETKKMIEYASFLIQQRKE